ncbi:MAG: hypothetical protein JXR89_05060, partial [Deltaproteobacteria bacterium]|nr:hypothetical protein [Deltaproteobacteria bacterium]
MAIERGMPAPEVYSSEDRQEAAPTAENGQQNATATSPVEAYFSQVTESLQISDQASALQQQTQAQERATDSGSGGNQPAEQMPGGQVAATYSASSADAPGNATATTSPASDVQAAAGTGVGPTYTSRAGGATAPMGGSA